MANIRISDAFFGLLKNKQRTGESMERVLLNQMNPLDKQLQKLWKEQAKRRRKKFKEEANKFKKKK